MSLKKRLLAAIFAVGTLFGSTSVYAQGELEHVTLTVLVNPLGSPHAFLKDDFMRPYGVDVDVIYELKRRLRFNLTENRVFVLNRDASLARIKAGSADIFCGGVSYTEKRAKLYDYSPVYYASSMGVMFNPLRHPEIKKITDIKGLRIGASRGSSSGRYVSLLGATPVEFVNPIMAYFHVFTGELDGVLFDRPPLAGFVNDLHRAEFAVTPEAAVGRADCKYGLILGKHSPYTEIISKTIREMLEDGTMDKILLKWNASEMSIYNSENY